MVWLETLSKARTPASPHGEAGILVSKSGKVHLLRPDELRGLGPWPLIHANNAWEVVHHLIGHWRQAAKARRQAGGKARRHAETARE